MQIKKYLYYYLQAYMNICYTLFNLHYVIYIISYSQTFEQVFLTIVLLAFGPDTLLLGVGTCPVHRKILSSIFGLYLHHLSCDNQKCLQILPNVPLVGQKSPLVENHCLRIYHGILFLSFDWGYKKKEQTLFLYLRKRCHLHIPYEDDVVLDHRPTYLAPRNLCQVTRTKVLC